MRTLFLAVFLAALAPSAAAAQPVPASAEPPHPVALALAPTVDTLRGTPEAGRTALEARIAALERTQAEQAAALEAAARREARAIRVSGEVFTRYGVNTSGTAGTRRANAFALDRFYLTARGHLADRLSFRGTTDVKASDGSDLGYVVFVKFAYFDAAVRPWLTLRAGIIPTIWQGHVSKVWGRSNVVETLAHARKHTPMADAGLAAVAELPGGYGEAEVQVVNGGGYKRLEADQFKDVTGRLVVRPFAATGGRLANVEVGAHAYRGTTPDGGLRARRGVLAAYRGDAGVLAVNAEHRRDGDRAYTSYGTFGSLDLGFVPGLDRFAVLALYDRSGPRADALGRTAAGLAFTASDALVLTLDYQRECGAADAFARYDGTPTAVDAGLFLHAVLSY